MINCTDNTDNTFNFMSIRIRITCTDNTFNFVSIRIRQPPQGPRLPRDLHLAGQERRSGAPHDIYVSMYVYIYIYVYVYMCIYAYIYIYIYV